MNFMGIFVRILCLLHASIVQGQKIDLDSPFNIFLLRTFKETILNLYGHPSDLNNPVYNEAQRQGRVLERIPENVPFPCNITNGRSKTVPTSVHKLRPGDIDIIGAMGDSLTAGQGLTATDFVNYLIENRGTSALGGGKYTWREYLTLPNILKVYNPNLYGYATDDAFSHQPASHFNVGENLAMSRDMPFMARNLVKRMKSDPRVDIENHWKLINLFIGANDMCSGMCYVEPPSRALENHRRDLIETFRILRDNLPRTIVVLIPVQRVDGGVELLRSSVFRLVALIGCPCFSVDKFKRRKDEFVKILKDWQQIDREIQMHPEFQTEDFSVTTQTFTTDAENAVLADGSFDLRYTSVDGFHWSQRTNAAMALALWQSLFTPVNNKSTFNFADMRFTCPPEERPYIATARNSG